MAYYGADPGQLRVLATQFNKNAGVLESHAMSLHSLIGSSTSWRGPDADRFRSQWSDHSFRAMSAAVTLLRQSAIDLQRNADEQEGISEGRSGTGGQSGSAAPTGASGLFEHIQNRGDEFDKDDDGVRIERVVGPDGETRLIAYFKGQDASENRDGWRSMSVVGGWVDPAITAKIDEALKSCPNGTNTEVMLVGFSQGGMDAQNIAASDKYNVTNLVTYGSPITQGDNPNIHTVHMHASGDLVPVGGAIGAGGYQSDQVFQSDANLPFGQQVHGDDAYENVAADFDKSTDSRFTDAKDSMKKFQGVVVHTDE
ncbi:MAG: hypothetical protein ACRDU5_14600 [Mycobacterium sp.]